MAGRYDSRSKKLKSHMLNHKHQAEWTNWKWYKIVKHSPPPGRLHPHKGSTISSNRATDWRAGVWILELWGTFPFKQPPEHSCQNGEPTRLHPSLMEPSFPWLCALLTTVLQLTLHWDQQCSNGLYTIYTSCEESSYSWLLTPRSLAQSWRMLGVLNSDFYLASSHARTVSYCL